MNTDNINKKIADYINSVKQHIITGTTVQYILAKGCY